MVSTPEAQARTHIDRQLTAAGWSVVASGSSVGSQPTALSELSGDTGRADYVLYLDGKACGIIEAKRSEHSLEGVQEQSSAYAGFYRWSDPETCWQNPLPFRFEANGRQIQFTDDRDSNPRARPIFHFPRPEHLRKQMTEATAPDDTLRRRLAALPTAHPLDAFMAGAAQPLRDCQHEAITGIFYAQGVKANVLFFERKEASETPWTKDLWIYDLRTNQHFTLKTNPLATKDLVDFIKVYGDSQGGTPALHTRTETDRFKKITYDEIVARDKANLDIFWLKDESLEDTENLPPPAELAADIVASLENALEEFRGVEDALNDK